MIHELKTWPAEFAAVLDETKHHEIRRADRPFAAGDILHLREYDPGPATYTGRTLYVAVTYISAAGTWGLPPDLCVMSLGLRADRLHLDYERREHVYQECWTPSGQCCVCELGDGTEGCTT